jgi:hypothetical protein
MCIAISFYVGRVLQTPPNLPYYVLIYILFSFHSYSESVDCAVESKLDVGALFNALCETPPPAPADKGGLAAYGGAMAKVLDVLCRIIVQHNSNNSSSNSSCSSSSLITPISDHSDHDSSSGIEAGAGAGAELGQGLLDSPLACERFLKVYWRAADVSTRTHPPSLAGQQAAVGRGVQRHHAPLEAFFEDDAMEASFR